MILTNRLFTRKPASREAKGIYIFCEGVKREPQYFRYFKEMDSRINIEIYPLDAHENNSPLGLLTIAKNCLLKSEENPQPKYEFLTNDEAWIVLDTDKDKLDSRKPQIDALRGSAFQLGYRVVESNPCFEVWLYAHFSGIIPQLNEMEKCTTWKQNIHQQYNGFDSRKHPIFIKDAIDNSKNMYSEANGVPKIGTTQVFQLAESIYSLVKDHIEKARSSLGHQ